MSKKKFNKALFNSTNFIKVLFPEIQVLEYIKENGIIDKKLFKATKKTAANVAEISTSKIGKVTAKNISNAVDTTEQAIHKVQCNVSSEKATNLEESITWNNENKNELDKAFKMVQNTMPEYVLGQKEFLNKLLIAFKRPFVYGKKKGISNAIFVTGPKGSGRHLAVKAITRFLKEQKIFKKSGTYTINLGKYVIEKDAENLFLTDLYNALCAKERVIIFENFDKCHSKALNIIENLVIDEKLKLNRRYIDEVNQMIDVTGKGNLILNTTDEISADDKYLVFITEKTEENIRSIFSGGFMEKIYDILHTIELTEESLLIIEKFILEDYKEKIKDNLNITLTLNENLLGYIIKNRNKDTGVYAIQNDIEEKIYKPLVELELTGKIVQDKVYILSAYNNTLSLIGAEGKIELQPIVNNIDSKAIDQLDKELDSIIGLQNVKTFIRTLKDNIKVQTMRRNKGQKEASLSLHMIFSGNPGTGKTTMARIIAKYLKTLGYLSSGHLVEVSRNDLVGQYVGETAEKTMTKVRSALGGILFIDEAYSLARGKDDVFGIEAVDSIVKAMEDNRNNLVIILAGYTDEMNEFMKTNSGLKSRFNYNIEFPDYTSKELLEISRIIAQSNGYKIDESLDELLISLFDKKQIKGKNDSGNGRLARNTIEQAIANQSNRLAEMDSSNISKNEMNRLIISDFGLDKQEYFNLEDELSKIIGLDEVKNFIRDLQKQLVAKEKRRQLGVNIESSQSLNMIFTGNPGTGKTTVARLISNLMKKMGILKSGQIIETDRSEIISQHMGETTQNVVRIFKSALGGILFIDEAYSLMSTEDDPLGKEAIDTLVKLVEDFREDIVVILAGYDKEMKEFIKTNSGLKSRFPIKIDFPDYNLNELLLIGKSMITSKGFILADNAEDELEASINEGKKRSGREGGNGRLVRNIIEKTIRNQSTRVADMEQIDEKSVVLLTEEDFGVTLQSKESFDLESKFNDIVGLEEVKEFIRSLQAQLKIKRQRKALGLPSEGGQTLHMIFKGNAGTGKTTMARIIGEVLYNLGVLNDRKFVETDRSGLVAGYTGQTAIKTKEKVESAIGGILFIDEAYALVEDTNGGFGKEAIDTLVKEIDDNREDLLVILAGYSKNMDTFLGVNPGLRSRFPNIIEFKDYSVEDLLNIADKIYKNKGYIVTDSARLKMKSIFEEACKVADFGNGRYVRNLFEKSIRNQAIRLGNIENLTKQQLITIEDIDISKVNL